MGCGIRHPPGRDLCSIDLHRLSLYLVSACDFATCCSGAASGLLARSLMRVRSKTGSLHPSVSHAPASLHTYFFHIIPVMITHNNATSRGSQLDVCLVPVIGPNKPPFSTLLAIVLFVAVFFADRHIFFPTLNSKHTTK